VSTPQDQPRPPSDQQPESDREDPSGRASGALTRQVRVRIFEAHTDAQGGWRLDDSGHAGWGRGGWVGRVGQCLLLALSLALAVALWLFAFALMLVLLPLAVLAGAYLWRRLKSLQRVHRARSRSGDPS
jgi:hypothetical protein